ncbi:MAG: AAA family ATPase [Chloroflexaceae bacterium]|nr:AAA family ATPase [Chloroflexaceae bacterium]
MLTRIEIDGFKTFQKFSLDLGPFHVIVGVNGTGKSNLFDALQLLSRLVDADLLTAFQAMRGEAGELFRVLPDGTRSDTITLAVELFINRRIRDQWGDEVELKYTRLRYEVAIQRRQDSRGLERLYVTHESLRLLARSEDPWINQYLGKERTTWLPKLSGGRGPFISTVPTSDADEGATNNVEIALHQDGRGGKQSSIAERLERTVLSGVSRTDFPHALAVREALRSLMFLQLNPEVIRQPSSMLDKDRIASDGRYIASTLARLKREDEGILTDISRDLANFVPGIMQIDVREDRARDEYLVYARTEDNNEFSSRVLSDGTLRLLALTVLKHDPAYHGVLCFEEPENGVHPSRLKRTAALLRELTTDFSDPEQVDQPLRQLLVNTHSPVFAAQPDVRDGLMFAEMVQHVEPHQNTPPARVTRITPIPLQDSFSSEFDRHGRRQLHEVIHFLECADPSDAIGVLQKTGRV